MRTWYERNHTRGNESLPWKWIIGIGAIILVLIVSKYISGSAWVQNKEGSLMVSPLEQSVIYISREWKDKTKIKWEDYIYPDSDILSVEVWGAKVTGKSIVMDIDKNSELVYENESSTWVILSLTKWRAWIEWLNWQSLVKLKNLSVNVSGSSSILIEQNSLYSNVYVLNGSTEIQTKIGNKTVLAWNRIMIAWSDLIWDVSKLNDVIGSIDQSIMQNPVFIRNWWEKLLEWLNSWSGITNSGMTISSSGSINSNTMQAVSIKYPVDWTLVNTATIIISGDIYSENVKRVTINDIDASVSPVNKTFTLTQFPIDKDIINLVYKAYDEKWNLLEKWVTTVFWSKSAQTGNNKLVPDNFPLENKDFKIVFPTENPYKTTENNVKVQGTVPKNMVKYIVVNDYKLQKFIPNSSVWYYYANTQTETMKDGINLYNIKFYGNNEDLLYTQLFTIVKENKNVLSGEAN
jgi:hypothetical protein